MRCVVFDHSGGPEVLRIGQVPKPEPAAGEILIRVAAAGVNRADVLQRKGLYPPPEGASSVLGLEVAGGVVAVGAGVTSWKAGDKVCALLAGGGYAEFACVRADHALPVPEGMRLVEAAVLPEAVATVWANLFEAASLRKGETVLIHGGAGGIGSMAIQMAKALGAKVVATAGNDEKLNYCRALGADLAVHYQREDYVEACLRATGGRGVDVVLDILGGEAVSRNMAALAEGGRHISLAFMKGREALVDIRLLMNRRLVLTGSTLRGRPGDEKARLIREVLVNAWPWVVSGAVRPQLRDIFSLEMASEAHKKVESGAHMGKIALEAGS